MNPPPPPPPSTQPKKLRWPIDYINLKCILYSFFVGGTYWYGLGHTHTPLTTALWFTLNYQMIMWYSYSYECQQFSFWTPLMYASLMVILFKYLPPKNKYILIAALYFPYLMLAWYDYLANCRFRMNPTIFPFGRWVYLPFKPPPYQERYKELDPVVKYNIQSFDKYVAVTVVFGAIGYLIYKVV